MSEAEERARGIAAAERAGMPVSDIDPYEISSLLNPYPNYAVLRDLGPVVWLSRYNCAFVGRYQEVEDVQVRAHDFVSGRGAGLADLTKPGAWRPPSPIVEVDPPEHTGIRMTMGRIFSPDRVKGWKARFSEVATEICESASAAGAVDGVDLAERYIFQVFSEALGVELDLRSTIVVGNFNFNAAGPKNDLFLKSEAASAEIAQWFMTRQQRESMLPGGVGEMVFAAEDEGKLPPGTASSMVRTLIRGGMDTTISGLGSTLRLLAENPAALARAKDDPAYAAAVFEEAIRLESPVQINFRTTNHAAEVSGVTIPADTKVAVCMGSANRDPRFWEDPDAFRPRERSGKHMAFAAGPHFCLGRQVSRLEVECFLAEFLKRVDRLEIAAPYRYREINGLRTLDILPLSMR